VVSKFNNGKIVFYFNTIEIFHLEINKDQGIYVLTKIKAPSYTNKKYPKINVISYARA
jgi:hypothetical protein